MNRVLSLLSGVVAIVLLILKDASEKKAEKEALKQEVYRATESADLVKLNLLIQHIHRL